jgi:hypothetical protein
VESDGTVDIIHAGDTGISFGYAIFERRKLYQIFVAPEDCTAITAVWVKLRRTYGYRPFPVVELQATNNNCPTGMALATSDPIDGIDANFQPVRASLPYSGLTPGERYAIVLPANAPGNPLGDDPVYEWAAAPVYDDLPFGRMDAAPWGQSWAEMPGVGNGWLEVGVIDAENTIDVDDGGAGEYSFGVDASWRLFQTFIAKGTQPIVGIDLKLRKESGSGSDVLVSMHEVDGSHQPKPLPLATAVIPLSSIGHTWTVVNAPLYYHQLSVEQEYAVVVELQRAQPCTYQWAGAKTNHASYMGSGTESSWGPAWGGPECAWMRVRVMSPLQASSASSFVEDPTDLAFYGFGDAQNEVQRFQVFPLPEDATVIGVDAVVRRISPITQTPDPITQTPMTCQLRATSGGFPFGPVLASTFLPACDAGHGLDYWQWTQVHFPLKSTALKAGDYALILGQVSPNAFHYEWGVDEGKHAYPFGRNDGTKWVDETQEIGNAWSKIWTTVPDLSVRVISLKSVNCTFGDDSGHENVFQTFMTPPPAIPGHWLILNGVRLCLKRVRPLGPEQSDIVVQLYAAQNGAPSGFSKATGIVPSSFIGTRWTYVDVPLYYGYGGPEHLQPATEYDIVLSQRVASDPGYYWALGGVHPGLHFGHGEGGLWIEDSAAGNAWMVVSLIQGWFE